MYGILYSYKQEPAFGTCTCGHLFDIPLEQIRSEGYYRFENVDMCCPHCGAAYGNTHRYYDAPWYHADRWTNTISGNKDRFVLYDIIEKDDKMIIKKEVAEEQDRNKLVVYQSSEIAFSIVPIWTIDRLTLNDKDIPATEHNIKKCLTHLTHHRDYRYDHLFDYVGRVTGSSALTKILSALVEYPFLQASWKNGNHRYRADRINLELLKPGESTDQKALQIPKGMLKLFREGSVTLHHAQYAVNVAGNELGTWIVSELQEMGIPIHPTNIDQMTKLTAAERRRLATYLTHDVAVYQGIEKPKDAWDILIDYWRMQDQMEIKRELCPKSLKLQHDIAARNYKLVLDERRHQAFIANVQDECCQRLNWKSPNGKWFIQTFAEPDDLIREGSVQSHCAGSYVSYIIEGKYRMYSLRRTAEPDRPVLTLTVDNDDCCIYYKGYDNRDASEEERAILESWANAKKLTLSERG